jgi:hypothetical protein
LTLDPVLDCPPNGVPDGEELIRAAMRWHFSPETGSPFWLRRAETLPFDPRTDVRTFADLALFPNVVNELRDVPVRDLVPRGYQGRARIVGVFESGGTTGLPKRVLLLADWEQRYLEWVNRRLDERGFPRDVDYLVVGPTGPHVMGKMAADLARLRGGLAFHIDFDPRWAKRCFTSGAPGEADRYAEHLIAQAEHVLRTQDVGVMVITPPLLERMTRRDALVELINNRLRACYTAGASMDPDTRHLLATEVFPGVALHGSYGGTMGMCPTVDRLGMPEGSPRVDDPFSPYVTFTVVRPGTGAPVAFGERGQIVMNHVSKSMLIPNNAERDLATRVEPLPGQLGDSVSDVAPMVEFDGETVVEGVY